MASEDIVIRFIVDDRRFKRQSEGVKRQIGSLEKQFSGAAGAYNSFIGNLAASATAAAFRGFVNLSKAAINNLIEFETALVGVGKTTNLTGKELTALGEDIQRLARVIPVPTRDLLQLTENAAQLGVRGRESLLAFTETAARLGVSTNLSTQEASVGLAKVLNLTGEATTEVSKLGAVIVELGNNFATTESDILNVSLEIARATTQFGLASEDVSAISAALSSLGIQAEVGGTSVGRAFRKIEEAIDSGGVKLERFVNITGLTAAELKTTFEKDAIVVFQKFIEGLSRVESQGGSLTQTLSDVGLANDRILKVLPPLAARYDLLAGSIERANSQVATQNALIEESDRFFDTLEGKINRTGNLLGEFGESALAGINPLAKTLTDVLNVALAGTIDLIDDLTGRQTQNIGLLEEKIKDTSSELEVLKQQAADAANQGLAQVQIDRITKELVDLTNQKFELQIALASDDERPILEIQKRIAAAEAELENTRDSVRAERLQKQIQNSQKSLQIFQEALQQRKQLEAQDIEERRIKEEDFAIFKQNLPLRLLQQEQLILQERNNLDKQDIERINNFVAQEFEVRRTALDEQLKLAGDNSRQREEIQKKISELEVEQTRRANRLIRQSGEQTLKGVSDSFGALADIAALGGEKTFKAVKVLQTASATVAGYSAIQQAAAAAPYPANIPGILVETARAATTLASINSQNPSFQQGGIVPGTSFNGDNVVANVNSAEMILNRAQQTRLFNIANGSENTTSRATETVINTTVEIDGETIARAVSRQVADGLELGENI